MLAVLRIGLARDAHHARNARAVDIGIEQADSCALGLQRQREIGRRRALADAALARSDREDVLDVRQGREVLLHLVRKEAPRSVDDRLLYRRLRLQRSAHLLRERIDPGLRRIAEHEFDRDVAVVDADAFDRAAGDEVLAAMRVDNRAEEFANALLRGMDHGIGG